MHRSAASFCRVLLTVGALAPLRVGAQPADDGPLPLADPTGRRHLTLTPEGPRCQPARRGAAAPAADVEGWRWWPDAAPDALLLHTREDGRLEAWRIAADCTSDALHLPRTRRDQPLRLALTPPDSTHPQGMLLRYVVPPAAAACGPAPPPPLDLEAWDVAGGRFRAVAAAPPTTAAAQTLVAATPTPQAPAPAPVEGLPHDLLSPPWVSVRADDALQPSWGPTDRPLATPDHPWWIPAGGTPARAVFRLLPEAPLSGLYLATSAGAVLPSMLLTDDTGRTVALVAEGADHATWDFDPPLQTTCIALQVGARGASPLALEHLIFTSPWADPVQDVEARIRRYWLPVWESALDTPRQDVLEAALLALPGPSLARALGNALRETPAALRAPLLRLAFRLPAHADAFGGRLDAPAEGMSLDLAADLVAHMPNHWPDRWRAAWLERLDQADHAAWLLAHPPATWPDVAGARALLLQHLGREACPPDPAACLTALRATEPDLPAVVSALAQAERTDAQRALLQLLVGHGHGPASADDEALAARLRAVDDGTVVRLATAWSTRGSEETATALRSQADTDPVPWLRAEAAATLVRHWPASWWEDRAADWLTDPDPNARWQHWRLWGAQWLAHPHGGGSDLPPALVSALGDPWPAVQQAAWGARLQVAADAAALAEALEAAATWPPAEALALALHWTRHMAPSCGAVDALLPPDAPPPGPTLRRWIELAARCTPDPGALLARVTTDGTLSTPAREDALFRWAAASCEGAWDTLEAWWARGEDWQQRAAAEAGSMCAPDAERLERLRAAAAGVHDPTVSLRMIQALQRWESSARPE